MQAPRRARETALCGVFGAAALLLPVLFHLVRLGHIFMPMYLPLMALSFYVGPRMAGLTALTLPLLSSAMTGMPPMYPPVALLMAVELSAMATIASWLSHRFHRLPAAIILAPTLVAGRLLYVGLVYLVSMFIDLPAAFVAGLSLLSGWPGVVLMLVAIPSMVKLVSPAGRVRSSGKQEI